MPVANWSGWNTDEYTLYSRGQILGRYLVKNPKNFLPCNSQSPVLKDFTPPPPRSKSDLKRVSNVNIVY